MHGAYEFLHLYDKNHVEFQLLEDLYLFVFMSM